MDSIKAYEIIRKNINNFDDIVTEALNKVAEDVLKQSKQKPVVKCHDEEQWLECPSCGSSSVEYIFYLDYCSDCGQAIDWSDYQINEDNMDTGEEAYLEHIDIYCE